MNIRKITTILLVCLLSLSLLLSGCQTEPGEVSDETSAEGSGEVNNDGEDAESGDAASDAEASAESEDASAEASGDVSAESGATTVAGGDNKPGVAGTTTKSKNNNATQSTTSAKPGKVVEASFTRNDDKITCTDKATGVVFLDDDLNDWSKTYERGEDGLVFDSNQADFLDGDSSRVLKSTPEATDAWFTYRLKSGITEVAIVALQTEVNGKRFETIELKVSKDNEKWTTVSAETTDVDLGSGWYKRVYRYTGIDKSNTYAKIVFKKQNGKADPFYNPNISRLRINNIAKMDDPDRFLEDRASATFYVDSKEGSDKNDGMSPKTAFKSLSKVNSKYYQPGDSILFKSGCSFNGSLNIKGYGEADARVTIGSYGSGSKPKISARGGTAVTVKCDYVTVENLEVTNPKGEKGIYIGPGKTGVIKGVIVQNNYVHDVMTDSSNFIYSCSGISAGTNGSAPTWYEGMIIRNNTVKNTSRTGIYCTTSWADRYGFGWGQSAALYKNDNEGWWPYENLQITGNTVDSPGGDGILVIGGRNTVIERNVVYNAFSTTRSFESQIACAGLWTINTNNTKVQYNDVGYTRLPVSQNGADGEGYDIDCAENGTIVQYNYSHNNEGGFLLLCDTEPGYTNVSKDHVVRFNLSVNDATRKGGQGVFMMTNTRADTKIYNNTIVAPSDGRNLVFTFGGVIKNVSFTNNILYGNASIKPTGEGIENWKFENNILANGAKLPSATGMTVSNNKTEDPKFKNASCDAYDDMKAMIEAFTPTNKIKGASSIANNGGKDINGTDIGSATFYGAVKY